MPYYNYLLLYIFSLILYIKRKILYINNNHYILQFNYILFCCPRFNLKLDSCLFNSKYDQTFDTKRNIKFKIVFFTIINFDLRLS